jgi:hypothetical protein
MTFVQVGLSYLNRLDFTMPRPVFARFDRPIAFDNFGEKTFTSAIYDGKARSGAP